jgi:hypothetical protein
MIVIKGIPLNKIQGITLFPFIIVSNKKPSKSLINHEKIHIRQQAELLIFPFYVWYLIEWIYHYLHCRSFWQAYRQIGFEREAYDNQEDFEYLKKRKIWSFLPYLRHYTNP